MCRPLAASTLALTLALLPGVSCTRAGDAEPQRPPESGVCKQAPPPPPPARRAWPALPRSRAAAEALVHARTRRTPGAAPSLEPTALLARLDAAPLVAGEAEVRRWLLARLARAGARDAYLLWGTYHDSGGQLEAFRRLLGPEHGLTHVVVEQLDADGAWADLPAAEQRGDTAAITAYLRRGDEHAWQALAAKQWREDYTAWKYGYLSQVMDLLVAARAVGVPLLGCDLPRPLQNLADRAGSTLYRVRELHCLLALEDALDVARTRPPRRLALLWGQDHVKPHGLRRFLPPGDLVVSVYLVGQRPGPLTPEAQLAKRLVVNDPLLFPLDAAAEELALLLPGRPLGGEVDRSREWLEDPALGRPGVALLRVESTRPGTLHLRGRMTPIGPAARELELPPGPAAYLAVVGGLRIAGVLSLAPGGRTELVLDAQRRTTRVHEQRPYPSAE